MQQTEMALPVPLASRTYVVMARGTNRGVVGWIAGDLAERLARSKHNGITKCYVLFPTLSFPYDFRITTLTNLRKATAGELARLESDMDAGKRYMRPDVARARL